MLSSLQPLYAIAFPSRDGEERQIARMNRDNRRGLSPLWPISLVIVWGAVNIVLAIRGTISSEWIGFAGNVVAGAMTLVAAWGAWLAVQKQIAGQKTIADGQKTIADRQGALQRFTILQQQLKTVENDLRLTGIVKRRRKELQQAYKEWQQAYFAEPSVQRSQVNDARKELEEKIQNLENLELNFTLSSTSRSALPDSIKTRKNVIAKLGDLKSAVEAARQALAAIPPKGADEISAQDLPIDIKNEIFDALHAACKAHDPVIRTEIRRLEDLIGEERKKAGL